MRSIYKIFFLNAALVLASACTHSVHELYTSDYSPYTAVSSSKRVEAKSEQFVILGFVTQTDYVDKAYKDIQEKCENGAIEGLTTEYTTSHGFLSYTNKIYLKGQCVTR